MSATLISKSAQVWHVLTRDHTALPATHTFIHRIHEWNEPSCIYIPAAEHFGRYLFSVPLKLGG